MYPKGSKWINSDWIPYFCKMPIHQDLQNTKYTTDFGYNNRYSFIVFQHWVVLERLLAQQSPEKCRGNKVILQHGITKNVGHRLLRDNTYRKHLYREILIRSEGTRIDLSKYFIILYKHNQYQNISQRTNKSRIIQHQSTFMNLPNNLCDRSRTRPASWSYQTTILNHEHIRQPKIGLY